MYDVYTNNFFNICFQACVILQSSLKKLTYQMHNNSFVIEKLLIYCDDIKTIRLV